MTTPSSWRVLDLPKLSELAAQDSPVRDQLKALGNGADEAAAGLAKLASEAAKDTGVLFTGVSIPGEEGNLDLTTLTVSVPVVAGAEGERAGEEGAREVTTLPSEPVAPDTRPGPAQNAVMLAAGPAARRESFDLLKLAPPLPTLPVFCIEYAVRVPHSDSVALLTFTTIAPSDPDALRDQFAEIASTLAFA